MEVHSYVLPPNEDVVDATASKAIEAIRIFSEIFGPYPFLKEKYGHAEFGWGGGMEHQTITSMGGWSTRLIVHELAHQWWGDMITCRNFHHIWLNEGFATYSEALYWEKTEGQSAYFQDMNSKRYLGSGSIYVQDLSNRSRIFHYGLSYMKSAWVLHMLRHVVGDETFFQILQTYYADPRFQHGSAVTEDFQEICEAVSGMNLAWFFQQWIYGEYYPVYSFNWHVKNSSAGRYWIDLTIEQRAKENFLFRMPIDVNIHTDLGDTTIVVWDSLEVQKFQIELPDKPFYMLLDQHGWILKEVYQPAQYGLEPFLEQNFPNPFYLVNRQKSDSPISTIISYQINHSADVKLTIYNILGQKVCELVNERQLPHYYPVFWDGKDDNGNVVTSGIYFYVLETGLYRKSKKLMVLR
jgi:aminopeptidase N